MLDAYLTTVEDATAILWIKQTTKWNAKSAVFKYECHWVINITLHLFFKSVCDKRSEIWYSSKTKYNTSTSHITSWPYELLWTNLPYGFSSINSPYDSKILLAIIQHKYYTIAATNNDTVSMPIIMTLILWHCLEFSVIWKQLLFSRS